MPRDGWTPAENVQSIAQLCALECTNMDRDLTKKKDRAIMKLAKGQLSHGIHAKSTSEMGVSGVLFFYKVAPFRYGRTFRGHFGLLSGLLPIKPLADVMANYTRHDRN